MVLPRPQCAFLAESGVRCGRAAETPPEDHPTRPPIYLCYQHWQSWDRWWAWTPARIAEKQEADLARTIRWAENRKKAMERRLDLLNSQLLGLGDQIDAIADQIPRPRSRGRIYVLRRHRDGAIKIGWTSSLRSRLLAHQRNHGALELLAHFAGTVKQEHALHARFVAHLAEGREWFHPHPELEAWISTLKAA